MKSYIAVILSLIILIFFSACGSTEETSQKSLEESESSAEISSSSEEPLEKPKLTNSKESSRENSKESSEIASESSKAPEKSSKESADESSESTSTVAETTESKGPTLLFRAYSYSGITHEGEITDHDIIASIQKALEEKVECPESSPPTGGGSSVVIREDGKEREYIFGSTMEGQDTLTPMGERGPSYQVKTGIQEILWDMFYTSENEVLPDPGYFMAVVYNFVETHEDDQFIIGEHARINVEEDWEIQDILSALESTTNPSHPVKKLGSTDEDFLTVEIFDTGVFTIYTLWKDTQGNDIFRFKTDYGEDSPWYLGKPGMFDSLVKYYFR